MVQIIIRYLNWPDKLVLCKLGLNLFKNANFDKPGKFFQQIKVIAYIKFKCDIAKMGKKLLSGYMGPKKFNLMNINGNKTSTTVIPFSQRKYK